MNNLLLIIVYFNFAYVLSQVKNVVIINNEMNEVMTEHITTGVQALLLLESDMNNVAKHLTELMAQKYGNNWNCLSLNSTCLNGIHLDHLKGNYIHFRVDNNNFIVYKSNQSTTESNKNEEFNNILKKAKEAASIETLNNVLNSSISSDVHILIENSLGLNFTSCEVEQNYANCYLVMAKYIQVELKTKYNLNFTVNAFTKRNAGMSTSLSHRFGVFRVGTLDFEVNEIIL